MKKLSVITLLFLTAISAVNATTIALASTSAGRSAFDSGSVRLPNGSLVRIGTFSNPGLITPALITVGTMESVGGWSQFGTLSTTSIFGNAGKLTGQFTDNTAAANAFNNAALYLWVFNASTTVGASETGIFRATAGSPAWTFPTNAGGVGDTVTLDMNDLTVAAVGSRGSASASEFKLSAINAAPEPTSAALLTLGLVSLASRRRRQMK